jgi:citrate synthase
MAQEGVFTYDPGFASTASCESKITYIDGDEGVLLYRGYPVEQLAREEQLYRSRLPAAARRPSIPQKSSTLSIIRSVITR